jgi:hypothetical protein
MVIKISAAGEIRALVLGAYRAATDRATRIALLRAMEPIGDARAAAAARDAIRGGGDLAVAAISVLRGLLHDRTAGSDVFDALVSTALDVSLERRVRLAAMRALDSVDGGTVEKLATAFGEERPTELDAIWKDSLEGHLPDDPRLVREAFTARSAKGPLTELRRLLDRIRAHEATLSEADRRQWQALRGSIHQALAFRGSRVALDDLRESIELARTQLPSSFVSAVYALGDSSCLEPIAAAYSRSAPDEDRWRQLLASAFRSIAVRERISKRHAVMKRIQTRWPAAGRHFLAGRAGGPRDLR